MFPAEAEFLGDARDAEGLAGKAGAEDVVGWNGVVGHGVDVAIRTVAEVGFVGDLRLLVPVAGKDAFAARALEGDAEATDATEEVYKSERRPGRAPLAFFGSAGTLRQSVGRRCAVGSSVFVQCGRDGFYTGPGLSPG